jgi:hypothetical protein
MPQEHIADEMKGRVNEVAEMIHTLLQDMEKNGVEFKRNQASTSEGVLHSIVVDLEKSELTYDWKAELLAMFVPYFKDEIEFDTAFKTVTRVIHNHCGSNFEENAVDIESMCDTFWSWVYTLSNHRENALKYTCELRRFCMQIQSHEYNKIIANLR